MGDTIGEGRNDAKRYSSNQSLDVGDAVAPDSLRKR